MERKHLLLTLGIALVLLVPGPPTMNHGQDQEPLAGKIELTIVLDQTKMIAGTEQFLEIRVRNRTSHSLQIPGLSADVSLRIFIVDQQGDTLRRGSIADIIGPIHKFTLNPGETVIRDEPLSWYRNMPQGKRIVSAEGTAMLPGSYTISVVLGGVASNTLAMHILEPPHDENEVAKLYRDATSSKHLFDEGTKMVEELLRRYPNSVYARNMYTQLASRLGLYLTPEKATRLQEVVLMGIDRFPDSQTSAGLIWYYLLASRYSLGIERDQRSTPEQIAELEGKVNALKLKYPGTRAARYASEQIEALNKLKSMK